MSSWCLSRWDNFALEKEGKKTGTRKFKEQEMEASAVEKEIALRSRRWETVFSNALSICQRVSVRATQREARAAAKRWATKAHRHPFQASLLGRIFQTRCRYNFPRFNQGNKPSGNKQNLCPPPWDVTHYSGKGGVCEEGCGRASLLLAQITTRFLVFSIKLRWLGRTWLIVRWCHSCEPRRSVYKSQIHDARFSVTAHSCSLRAGNRFSG